MATTSQIKTALDNISAEIRSARDLLKVCQTRTDSAHAALVAIPTKFSAELAAIDGLGNDPFEAVAKDEKAKMATEFTALRDKALTAKQALAALDFDS